MRRVILWNVIALYAIFCAGLCFAQQVMRLPEDGNKWYISVVGDSNDARYQEVLRLFDEKPLADLKAKTHFIPVTTDNAIFTERYKPTIKGLPTVRVQDADGNILYEATGDNLPITAKGLYAAIASGTYDSEALLRRHRRHDNPQPEPQPEPTPQPPPHADPPPQPINDGGAPVLDEPSEPVLWPIGLCAALLTAGLIWGKIEKARAFYKK